MIKSVHLGVSIYGLDDETTEIIRRKVEDFLRESLKPVSAHQIKVQVDAFTGTPER